MPSTTAADGEQACCYNSDVASMRRFVWAPVYGIDVLP